MKYDFEIPCINKEIRKHNAKCILIQLPEGLKQYAKEIMDKIDAECVLSADPCYGACDLQRFPECDLIVHFAHSKISNEPNVLYIECKSDADISKPVEKALKLLKGEKIGLVTTIQHIHKLDEVRKILEKNGFKVLVGKKGPKCVYDGQVLGCDVFSAMSISDKVDSFLFIGSGLFHPLVAAYYSKKPVIKADPETGKVEVVSGEKFEREKHLRREKAHNAKSIGIVIGIKNGQQNMRLARKLKRQLKNSYLIMLNEITPERLDYLPFDIFVITACPRIVLDDWKNFKKPIFLPEEI